MQLVPVLAKGAFCSGGVSSMTETWWSERILCTGEECVSEVVFSGCKMKGGHRGKETSKE